MTKRWYVVQAYSGYEKRVKQQIEERIKLHGLESFFGKVLVRNFLLSCTDLCVDHGNKKEPYF